MSGTLTADSVNIGTLTGDEELGTTSFDVDMAVNVQDTKPFPAGRIEGEIHNIYYKGYNYQNILLEARSTASTIEADVSINDESLTVETDFVYAEQADKSLSLNLLVERFNPHALHLTDDYEKNGIEYDRSQFPDCENCSHCSHH